MHFNSLCLVHSYSLCLMQFNSHCLMPYSQQVIAQLTPGQIVGIWEFTAYMTDNDGTKLVNNAVSIEVVCKGETNRGNCAIFYQWGLELSLIHI